MGVVRGTLLVADEPSMEVPQELGLLCGGVGPERGRQSADRLPLPGGDGEE